MLGNFIAQCRLIRPHLIILTPLLLSGLALAAEPPAGGKRREVRVPAAAAPAVQAQEPPARLEAETGGVSAYRLANGFKIILAPFPAAPNARVELLVKSGSKHEGYGEAGMAHLLEHMLFKSAGPRTDLKADLTALGATWNGTTNFDRTNYFATVAADPEKIDAMIRLEADRFIRASFTQEHLRSEMTVVRNELERADSDPDSVVLRSLYRQSFFWHGYSRPTIGARSDIEEAPFAALQAFHRRHYRPDNAALIVAGNFDPARVLKLASQLFAIARNPDTPRPQTWTREEARPVINRADIVLPAGVNKVVSGWKLPGATERATYGLMLAADAICAQDWGSLRQKLVLDEKVASYTNCATVSHAEYGLLVTHAGIAKSDEFGKTAQAVRAHLEAVAAKGISAEELERARRLRLNQLERQESAYASVAGALSAAETAGDWRLYFWMRDVIGQIPLEEVNAALKKWIVPFNRADVTLRHGTQIEAPQLPKPTEAASLVDGRSWAPLARSADPVPGSARELAEATRRLEIDGARIAWIPRRTEGDLAWLILRNRVGNPSLSADRLFACLVTSQLVSRGGGGLTRDQMAAKLEALRAQVTLTMGAIAIDAPRANIDAVLDVLLPVWAEPALPEKEFELQRTSLVQQNIGARNNPASLAADAVSQRFNNYPEDHQRRPRTLEKTAADLRALQYADIVKCRNDVHGLGEVTLAVVGNFSADEVQGLWQRFAKLPKSPLKYARAPDPLPPEKVDETPVTVALPERPNATVQGTALLRVTDTAEDYPALTLAVRILGGDSDSRINQSLRERKGLAYSASAGLNSAHYEPRSRLTVQASAATPQAEVALGALQAEVSRALQEGFTEAEVERARKSWLESYKTWLTNEKSFASRLDLDLQFGQGYAWLADFQERLTRLNARDVSEALRKYLGPAPIVWSVGKGK